MLMVASNTSMLLSSLASQNSHGVVKSTNPEVEPHCFKTWTSLYLLGSLTKHFIPIFSSLIK